MSSQDAIGGYFSLELPTRQGALYPEALRFQSARAAFLALLRHGQPARVWMPWYICDSMIEPLRMANIPVARYTLDADFRIAPGLSLGPDEWLLYVNYFGLSADAVQNVLERFPPQQVIIDCAQALFSSPRDSLATIYSPRKFVGVPDGGYLVTTVEVAQPATIDDGSADRARHLLQRAMSGAEAGYASFGAAEASLSGLEPQTMSALTEKILDAIDYSAVRARRRANFAILQAALQGSNLLQPMLEDDAVPLCYPYRSRHLGPDLRKRLIAERIFVATYWPDVLQDCTGVPQLEQTFARDILPLPCDQRYDAADMQRILDVIQQADMKS